MSQILTRPCRVSETQLNASSVLQKLKSVLLGNHDVFTV